MERIHLTALVGLLAMQAAATAQPKDSLPAPIMENVQPTPVTVDISQPSIIVETTAVSSEPYRIWASAEYLLWQVKGSSLPQITTGDPVNDTYPGAFGQPGTQVVGGGNVNFGRFAGGRITAGAWLGEVVGFEASGFLLEQRISRSSLGSDPTGNPYLSFPVYRSDKFREGAFTISDPTLPQSGSVAMSLQSQLWGAEANFLVKGLRTENFAANWLAGFRYMDLYEVAQIRTDANNSTIGYEFQQTTIDGFLARNQFYGGQLGAQFDWRYNRFSFGLTTKVALGSTRQTVGISGTNIQSGPGSYPAPGTLNEGVFAQSTNIGTRQENQFSVIPQIQAKLSFDIFRNVTGFVGYDLIYWTGVVRAGDQIDRNINFSQSQVFGTGVLAGSPDPSPAFRRTDFLAHGLNFGIQFRY